MKAQDLFKVAPGSGINSVFSVPPYQSQQLETPGIHTVLKSFDVFGGPHTLTVGWATSEFRAKNPVLFKAIVSAMREATELVNKDLKKASQYWIDANKAKMTIEKVTEIAGGPQVKWTMVPEHTLKFVEFMHSVGTIKVKTADWKDLFFPEIHDLPGS